MCRDRFDDDTERPFVTDNSAARPESASHAGIIRETRSWWRQVCNEVDQVAVIEKVQGESVAQGRYIFMTAMSAGIAILGMLLSSPAVVIGAMLLSPLMGPIMGAGFAMAIGDFRWLHRSGLALAVGTLVAILFCALIVLLSPLQTVTEEIAARTRPNLFDLAVALFSALAGAYAMIKGREGTIVGVAIATALMPPLAAVGFGLATANWTVFGGALLLFFTNLMTIALTAAAMARLYGFRTSLSSRSTMVQSLVMAVLFIGLAIPLGFSLQQIAWEANATRTANGIVADQFEADARVSQVEFDFDADPIRVTASVLTPTFEPDAQAAADRALQRSLGREIDLVVNQYRVGTDARAAEAAEIAAARAQEEALATEREITQLADRLSLIAGVPVEDVTIDRNRRRAIVRARPLPGAGLETYYALERRVASVEDDWTIQVTPPAAPLPTVTFGEDGPDEAGQRALRLSAWAARRIDAPIGVAGPEAQADRVLSYFADAGVRAVRREGGGALVLNWLAPDAE